MKPTLDGVVTKVVRAYQQLDGLDRDVQCFIETRPYRPVVEQDPDPKFFRVLLSVRDVPPLIGVGFGEVVQSMRTALDYLAWQLVIDHGGTPRAKGTFGLAATSFPIHLIPPRDGNGHARPARIFPHISQAASDFLQRVQPYNTRPEDPDHSFLAVLNELANIDNHRELNTSTAFVVNGRLAAISRAHRLDLGVIDGVFKNNAEIGRFPRSVLPEPDMDMVLEGIPAIAIAKAGSEGITTPSLRQIIDAVARSVVGPFMRVFQNL